MMDGIIAQLASVRAASRTVLILRSLLGLFGVLCLCLLFAGAVDYVLRMPGWMRLVVVVFGGVFAVYWLIKQLSIVYRYRPSLSALAMRAEQLYPELRGVLAAGIDLHLQGNRGDLTTSAAQSMTDQSLQAASEHASKYDLKSMVVRRRLNRIAISSVLVGLVVAGLCAAAPDVSSIALRRWFVPLGDAQWPRRTDVVSDTMQSVWPDDTPLLLRASIIRGYYSGMRAWVHYRVGGPAGGVGWQSLLMSEQADALTRGGAVKAKAFERLIDIDSSQARSDANPPIVEFYFSAGDDQTDIQKVQLVSRPSVRSISTTVTPPSYAEGLVKPVVAEFDTLQERVAPIEALIGSSVGLSISFNKSMRIPSGGFGVFLPGLKAVSGSSVLPIHTNNKPKLADGMIARVTVDRSVESPIILQDKHGLASTTDPQLRIHAVRDRQASVTITEPSSNLSMLPTAQVKLGALAQDDVGLESLWISLTSKDPIDIDIQDNLPKISDRSKRLSVDGSMDLRELPLNPGDRLIVTAMAQDVYVLDEIRHPVAKSTPRYIDIIDTATMVLKLQSELAGMRRQVKRTRGQQEDLLKRPTSNAATDQRRITDQMASMARTVEAIDSQMRQNRLEAHTLSTLVKRSNQLLHEGMGLSQKAQESLGSAVADPDRKTDSHQSTKHQQGVVEKLERLEKMLGQGRDVLEHQMQLRKLRDSQSELAGRVQKLLTKTLGKSFDQLSQAEQEAIKNIVEQQSKLTEQAKGLEQQMRVTADGLAAQGNDPQEQAAARALQEAAAIAQRQALSEQMQQAASNAGQNQMAAAGANQQGSVSTMQQMLDALADVEKHHQDILRRRVQRLVEAIANLLKQQRGQRERLLSAKGELNLLEAGQETVRRNTLVVADSAEDMPSSEQISKELQDATVDQRDAVTSLRRAAGDDALRGEDAAIGHLESALKIARQMTDKAEKEQAKKQRQELKQAYEQLAVDEDQIRDETRDQLHRKLGRRRMRLILNEVAQKQDELKQAASDLVEQVDDTVVFIHLHKLIDELAGGVVQKLNSGVVSIQLVNEQGLISTTLRQMAEALDEPEKEDDFSDGSGGGSGGGGSSDKQMIPPLRELVLLRSMQESIRIRTTILDQNHPELKQEMLRQGLRDLSKQQHTLADLAGRLRDKVEKENLSVDPAVDE